jgi:hypothetical protein
MAGATNTIIQILRSDVTAYPTTLNPGEQAYSYVSDKLFVGNTDNSVVTIGGKYYVDLIDGATAVNTGNTLVRRDNSGNVAFTMVSVTDDASQSTDVVNKNYLDTRINALSSNTIYEGVIGSDGYSNVHTSNTDAGGSVIIVANNSTVATFTETTATIITDVGITGNLVVKGTTSYTNVQSLLVSNNDIVLNANASGYPLINAYITVNRGAADNSAIIWNESTDRWQVDNATGTNYDIVDTAGGQSIGGTTTLNAASVTNGLHAGSIETSGAANVASLQANGAIYADQLYVTANVQLANVANVAYFSNISHVNYPASYKHVIVMADGVTGNNHLQANTLLTYDASNTTLEVGYSGYTPLPNTMYQGTGSSNNYVQNNLQNLNNEGSSDYVITADNGSDTHGFLDVGLGGGNYDYQTDAGGTGPFKPNDGWIQVVGNTGQGKGNLVIATGTSNTSVAEVGSIIFSVGNQTYSNIAGYISRQGDSPIGDLTWAINKVPGTSPANYNYKLDVNGSANVASLYINNTQVLGESFALPVSFGGTGLQTVTANSVLYGNGTGAFGVTAAPSAGQVLQYRTDGVTFGGLDGGTF